MVRHSGIDIIVRVLNHMTVLHGESVYIRVLFASSKGKRYVGEINSGTLVIENN